MDKFDKQILKELSNKNKFDSRLAKALSNDDKTNALVRVRNPIHLGVLERNFEVTNLYPFIRSVGIKCSLQDAIRLERMQEVEYVSAQGRVTTLDENTLLDSGKNENIVQTLSADLTGKGATLCVLDTGVSPHSDLSVPKDRIVHFQDFVNGESYPYDDNGHGTLVAGIACGNGMLSAKQIVGVAPEANVVSLKVIDKSGESGTFKILDGMQWLFDNFRQYGISVACMSFGAEPAEYADPLKIAVEMLVKSGLTVVVASGNSGVGGVKSPAISPIVISVGAVDKGDEIASFSSRGVYQGVVRPDLYADGVDVKGAKAGGTYAYMSGTSASAPYVAGACCLLHQKYKNLTPQMVKQMLLSSCVTKEGNKILRL